MKEQHIQPVIRHLFPGGNLHHTPYMVAFFRTHSRALGTDGCDVRFTIFGDEDVEVRSRHPELGPRDVELLPGTGKSVRNCVLSAGRRDILILHGGFIHAIWESLLEKPELRATSVWVAWGGELQAWKSELERFGTAPAFRVLRTISRLLLRRIPSAAGLSFRVIRRVLRLTGVPELMEQVEWVPRWIVIPRLRFIATLVPSDFECVTRCFGQCRNYTRAFYPLLGGPDPGLLTNARDAPSSGPTFRILLGNSGAASNNHIAALNRLARFADEDIQIVCPLGYGAEREYINAVCREGERLFGSRFLPILDMLSKSAYNELLVSVDALVFEHDRQQGLFCVYCMLARGKKLYMRSTSPTLGMLRELGAAVIEVESLPQTPFDSFRRPLDPAEVAANRKAYQENLSTEASVGTWRRLFSDLLSETWGPPPRCSPRGAANTWPRTQAVPRESVSH